jgi:hypothetical protein
MADPLGRKAEPLNIRRQAASDRYGTAASPKTARRGCNINSGKAYAPIEPNHFGSSGLFVPAEFM